MLAIIALVSTLTGCVTPSEPIDPLVAHLVGEGETGAVLHEVTVVPRPVGIAISEDPTEREVGRPLPLAAFAVDFVAWPTVPARSIWFGAPPSATGAESKGPPLAAWSTQGNADHDAVAMRSLSLSGDLPSPESLINGVAIAPDRLLLFDRPAVSISSDAAQPPAPLATPHADDAVGVLLGVVDWQAGTLHLVRQRPAGAIDGYTLGPTAIVDRPDDIFVHIYFARPSSRNRHDLHLARIRRERAGDPIAFEYFDVDAGRFREVLEPFPRPLVRGVGLTPQVEWCAAWGRYVMVYRTEIDLHPEMPAGSLILRLATLPEGPWSAPVRVAAAHGAVDGFAPVQLLSDPAAPGSDGSLWILGLAPGPADPQVVSASAEASAQSATPAMLRIAHPQRSIRPQSLPIQTP